MPNYVKIALKLVSNLCGNKVFEREKKREWRDLYPKYLFCKRKIPSTLTPTKNVIVEMEQILIEMPVWIDDLLCFFSAGIPNKPEGTAKIIIRQED